MPQIRKGPRTAGQILDAAERLFALHGYAGTSLRAIARNAGLQEPGIYNHFDSKQAIHAAVLQRALDPIGELLADRIAAARTLPDFIELPGLLMDQLAVRPHVAALLQRAMREESHLQGNALLHQWMARLFSEGMGSLAFMAGDLNIRRDTLSINLVAIFNLATGYFVSQPALDTLAAGDLLSEDNIAQQKRLLHRVIRAMMVS